MAPAPRRRLAHLSSECARSDRSSLACERVLGDGFRMPPASRRQGGRDRLPLSRTLPDQSNARRGSMLARLRRGVGARSPPPPPTSRGEGCSEQVGIARGHSLRVGREWMRADLGVGLLRSSVASGFGSCRLDAGEMGGRRRALFHHFCFDEIALTSPLPPSARPHTRRNCRHQHPFPKIPLAP